jgi:N-acetylglucosamine kinase-like BadF-type ATPase
MMRVVIGIDGGGTTTKALAAGTDGRIIGYGESGPSNYQAVGAVKAGQVVLAATQSALGDKPVTPDEYFLGMAGVRRSDDRMALKRTITALVQSSRVTVATDAYIALAGGTVCRPGVVVIAGTGAIAFGVNRFGREACSGGWGYLLGDEGSAYDLGRRGMIAVLREADGRGAATALTGYLLDYLGLSDRMELERIVTAFYQKPTDRRLIAEFARMVTQAADAGDRMALRIVHLAARELSLAARAVLRKLEFTDGPGAVIITGGVFDAAPLVTELFTKALKRSAPGLTIARPRFKPVVGALLLALQKVNGELSEELLERMAVDLPEELKLNRQKAEGME